MYSVKLSELNVDLYEKYDSWKVIEDSYEEDEIRLVPAQKSEAGLISNANGEVWCISKAVFNDKKEFIASAMCRGDSSDPPLLWSVWNGSEFVNLIVPPAPDFVLETEGPVPFCQKFNKTLEMIFPINFQVVPKFEKQPHKRNIIISANGVI